MFLMVVLWFGLKCSNNKIRYTKIRNNGEHSKCVINLNFKSMNLILVDELKLL
jgi:hypothetical protein